MPVGGEQLIAGSYTATWNGAPCGLFEGDEGVPAITLRPIAEKVQNTDRWGKIPIDSVHMGGLATFMGRLMEYPLALPILWPFGLFGTSIGAIGTLKYPLSRPLVLTSVAGTTASNSPATLTAAKSIIADDFDVRIKFGPTVRIVPIKLDLYPYQTGNGVYGWFTMTP